jgi:hypothetical protein
MAPKGYKLNPEQKKRKRIADLKYYAKYPEKRKALAKAQHVKDKASGAYDRRERKKRGLTAWRGVKIKQGEFVIAFE